jgi:hypothetical protein
MIIEKQKKDNLKKILFDARSDKESSVSTMLFWIDINDELQSGVMLNLIGVDWVLEGKIQKMLEIQSEPTFKCWIY